MVAGINDVFDNVVKYIKKNYSKAKSISMPYCVLTEDLATKERYYRAQVHFNKGGQLFSTTAILKANVETGKVYWFQEGFTWQYWTS